MSTRTRTVTIICSSALFFVGTAVGATPAEAGSLSANRGVGSHAIKRCGGHPGLRHNVYRLFAPDPGATYRLVWPCRVSKSTSTRSH